MTLGEEIKRASNWTRYWATGALHSCVGSFEGNYGKELAAFWLESLHGVSADSRLLDIATGNGPVPKLLLDTLESDRLPTIEAVDLSMINPTWPEQYAEWKVRCLRFRGQVQAEHLPYEDGSFDFIVSQYGFEYAERRQAISEVLRVAKAKATVIFVLHHVGSWPAKIAVEEHSHIVWLLSAGGLFDAVEALGPLVDQSRREGWGAMRLPPPQAESSRRRYNALQRELEARTLQSAVPDLLNEVAAVLVRLLAAVPSVGWGAVHPPLAKLRLALEDSALRLQELGEHALTDAQAEELCVSLRSNGFACVLNHVEVDGREMGWALRAHRGGGMNA